MGVNGLPNFPPSNTDRYGVGGRSVSSQGAQTS